VRPFLNALCLLDFFDVMWRRTLFLVPVMVGVGGAFELLLDGQNMW
jgi:hypothetical protein